MVESTPKHLDERTLSAPYLIALGDLKITYNDLYLWTPKSIALL